MSQSTENDRLPEATRVLAEHYGLSAAEVTTRLVGDRLQPESDQWSEAAPIDVELQDLQSFVTVETGHMPTVNAVARLRSRVAKALGHTDPYCVNHCSAGSRHSQCGCACNHRHPSTPPEVPDAEAWVIAPLAFRDEPSTSPARQCDCDYWHSKHRAHCATNFPITSPGREGS